jgi:hypothetical protein
MAQITNQLGFIINPSTPQYRCWGFFPLKGLKIFDLVTYPLIID